MSIARAVPLFCLALGVVGCGSDSEDAAADQALSSENGAFKGSFKATPSAPVVGTNSLEAMLTDAESAPLLGATLAVVPWMPAHGHGSSVTPTVTEKGQGEYSISEIVYGMPGDWELRIDVSAGQLSDRFVLEYQVK